MIMQTSVTADVSRKLRTKAAINFPYLAKTVACLELREKNVHSRIIQIFVRYHGFILV